MSALARSIAIACIAFSTVAGMQDTAAHTPVRIVFPRGVDPSACLLQYQLIGAFGGYARYAHFSATDSDYEIETVHEAQPVDKMKGYVACTGHQGCDVRVRFTAPARCARRAP